MAIIIENEACNAFMHLEKSVLCFSESLAYCETITPNPLDLQHNLCRQNHCASDNNLFLG